MRIKFETAEIAKEKGFNVACQSAFVSSGGVYLFCEYDGCGMNSWYSPLLNDHVKGYDSEEIICCPIQSELFDWLKETHQIEVFVLPVLSSDHEVLTYGFCIYYSNKEVPKDYTVTLDHTSYNDAWEAGLVEGLKLIKDEEI